MLRRIFLAVAILGAATTCGPSQEQPAPVVRADASSPPARERPAPPASTVRATETATAPLASSTAPPTTSSKPVEPPVVVLPPAPSSTPGKIWCAGETCNQKLEVCCERGVWHGQPVGVCVPKPKDLSRNPCPAAEYNTVKTCDEAADCPGQRCCIGSALSEGDFTRVTCGRSCEAGEACLPGSSCPNGSACAETDPDFENERDVFARPKAMECPLQHRPAVCGAKRCKLGEKCCWNFETKKGDCAETCADGEGNFHCTNPRQCAPYRCESLSGVGPWFWCSGPGTWQGTVICNTARDCPRYNNSLGPGYQLKGCLRNADMPPGVKTCKYVPNQPPGP